MSRGINKVMIIGNLGNDPDVRFTQSGDCVANLSVATDESYKDKASGQMVPKTEWHRVVLFGRTAEVAKEYLKKGSKVYIEGKLETRKWQDQNGQDRYTTEVKGRKLQMLDGRGGAADSVSNSGHQGAVGGQSSPQATPQPVTNYLPDDIPF